MRQRLARATILLGVLLLPSLAPVATAQSPQSRRETADGLVGSGLRRIESRHLILYTDLEAAPEVDELGEVFDRAVPQWCDYFQIEADLIRDWRLTAYLMQNADRFRSAGLLPRELPDFRNGYQVGEEFWVHEQPSAYYRRHLLLHEGTHAFMNLLLGNAGPPWFSEGMAEYLATHRWHEGNLQLAYVPSDNEEVPEWGRVKIIKDRVAAGSPLSLVEVMEFGPRAHLEVEPYGWCWAAVLMLDHHPSFHDALHSALDDVDQSPAQFTRSFQRRLGTRWREAELNWQVLLTHMDYGYDVRRAAVQLAPERPLSSRGDSLKVSAEGGWQSSGLRLEEGRDYEFIASGRFRIAERAKPWPCEAGGVTIEYYQGKPLGMLLAAIVPDEKPDALRAPIPIGVSATITAPHSGTLFFCVNESPANLADNQGELLVKVKQTN